VFFHRSECQSVAFEALTEGQEVNFDRESDVKGPRARNVRAV
jgi:cold shock CspA family protein